MAKTAGMANVVCIKWGRRYGADYVNKLYGMTARGLKRDFRFACFTDDTVGLRREVEHFPIPFLHVPARDDQPWRKIALFAGKLGDLSGPTLFLDLDVLVTGELDALFDLPGDFCIIENWTQVGRGVGNTSVFRFEAGAHPEVYAAYEADPEKIQRNFANEQTFVSRTIGRERLTFWPKPWVTSFKYHALAPYPLRPFLAPSIPSGARIIAFHGHPKMDDAAKGVWPGKWYKLLKPSPWISDIWRE